MFRCSVVDPSRVIVPKACRMRVLRSRPDSRACVIRLRGSQRNTGEERKVEKDGLPFQRLVAAAGVAWPVAATGVGGHWGDRLAGRSYDDA